MGWWLVVLVGVLSIVAGVIIVAEPSSSLATFGRHRRGLVALLGVVPAIVGVLLIRHQQRDRGWVSARAPARSALPRHPRSRPDVRTLVGMVR